MPLPTRLWPAPLAALLALAAAPALAAGPPPSAARKELARLQGAWRLVEVKTNTDLRGVAEWDGKEWVSGPGLEAARVRKVRGVTLVIEGDRLIVKRGKGAPPARELWLPDCALRADPSTSPRGLDLTPVAGRKEDRHAFGACYMLDGDELLLCDHGGNSARPKDFSMGVGIAYPKRIFVLKREPAKRGGM